MEKLKTLYQEYKCYFLLIICLWICYFFKPYLDSIFIKVADIIKDCSHGAFALGIIAFSIISSVIVCVRIKEEKKYLSHRTLSFILFLVIIYVYYRCLDKTVNFEFWSYCDYITYIDTLIIPVFFLVLEKIIYKKNVQTDYISRIKLLDDLPIKSSNDDILGRQKLAETLYHNLMSLDISKHAYSVGITGSWGEGKSSFLNMFENEVAKRAIIVRFYPRTANSVKKIQETFFSVFSSELGKYNSDIKYHILKYASVLEVIDDNWIGKFFKLINRLSAETYKSQINEAIDKTGRKVFVIIEDLDRLTGEEIMEVLKLIDSNADFKNTIFLTAYDKSYINNVINTYVNNKNDQDFTDKYFNYEVSLPPQSLTKIRSYIYEYLKNNIKYAQNDSIDKKEMFDVWIKNAPFIIFYVNTIRHAKRFINLFINDYIRKKNDVDLRDFLLVTLLKYTDINTYTAIVQGKILVRGSQTGDGNKNIYYLQSNIDDVLKHLNSKYMIINILREIFPAYDQIKNVKSRYNKVDWVDSLPHYFYEYEQIELKYEDVLDLFVCEDDDNAYKMIDNLIGEGMCQLLLDFIINRGRRYIKNINDVGRLLKISMFLEHRNPSSELKNFLLKFIDENEFDEINKFKYEDYKEIIENSLHSMIAITPETVAFICKTGADNIVRKENYNLIFSIQELETILISTQKEYYKLWGTEKFFFNHAIDFVFLLTGKESNGKYFYSINTRRKLKDLMNKYPNEFAHKLIQVHDISQDKVKHISVFFNEKFKVNDIFPIDNYKFRDWVNTLSYKEKFVVDLIYSDIESNANGYIYIKLGKIDYNKDDFESLYEVVKLYKNEDNDSTISYYIKHYVVNDLKSLSDRNKIAIDEVKESIRRLVDKQILDSKYLHLKDKMEDFKEGDFVSLSLEEYNKLNNDLPFIFPNIYRIKQILQGNGFLSYSLEGLSKDIPSTKVRPIPIDGVKDKDFYLKTYCTADFADEDGNLPTHKSGHIYYVEEMKTRKDSGDEESYYDKMIKNNCQYVHEVQHLMRELDGGNELGFYITA